MAKLRENNGDAQGNSGTQYTVSVGDEFHGKLNPVSDTDWLRVELTAGTIYDIILNGVYSAQLTILDARGNEIANGISNFDFTKIRIFSPDTSGTYYISIGSSNTDHTADYQISLDENPITTVSHDVIADYISSRRPHTQAFGLETGGVLTVDITDLNEAGQQLARWALEAWAGVTGIEFEFVNDDDAHITFDDNQDRPDVATAERSTSEGFIVSAHINVPASWITGNEARIDSHVFYAYLHEIGHALGLDHPGPYSEFFRPLIDKIFLNDTWQTTVMSYFRQDHDKFVDASFAYPVTPMVADIIAIQDLYGVPVDINPGDTVYGYGSNVEGYLGELFERWTGEGGVSFGNPVTLTLHDSGGIDTLDLRTDTTDQQIDLRPEGFSDVFGLAGNLIIAQDTLIENYIAGSGNDAVTGNDAANYLQGRDGNDDLRGGGGNDVLEGGGGADQLDGGSGLDWTSYRESNAGVTVNMAEGTLTGGHADGDVLINIENIIGSGHVDTLTGDAGANSLEGGSGADRLAGGAGEDTASYAQSDAAVVVRLHSGEARGGDASGDTFVATVTVEYIDGNDATQQETVPDIEHLVGSAHADILAGDSRANHLAGGPGNDRLYGGPGGGDDVLSGGPGEDSLFGGTGDDVMEGGADADTLRGGAGADTAAYSHSSGVEVRLHDGTARGGDAEGDVLDGIENLTGSAYADILEGDENANRLDGGAGVDWLSYAGSDAGVDVRLRNGIGTGGHAEGDVITGFENVEGSDYNDVLGGDSAANHLAGGAGNDGLWSSSGNDILEGGAGTDRMYGGSGTDTVVYRNSDAAVTVNLEEGTGTGGHAQGDTIAEVENVDGSGFGDVLEGDGAVNRLYGGEGDDELKGGGGNDVLEGGAGADQLDGGTGVDTVTYQNSNAAVTVNLGDRSATGGHAEGDVFTSVEKIIGSVYGDILVGGDGTDLLDGAGGDDELEGGAGADRLDGGAGTDTAVYRNSNAGVIVNLGSGTFTGGHAEDDTGVNIENLEGSDYDDVLTGDSSANRLYGGEGNDILDGGEGIDRLDGGPGVDTVSYANAAEGMYINLRFNTGSRNDYNDRTEQIVNVENVIGTDHLDSIRGDSGKNDLYGREGNDSLNGGAGDDRLFGEAGDDELWGLTGADLIDGGKGIDIAVYWSSDAAVTVNLATGTGQGGHAEGDEITGVENLWGSDHADTLSGDNGANRLYGGRGDDELRGNSGDDVLEGDLGADRLDGGPGMDMASYSLSNEGVTVKLGEGIIGGGHADGDVLVSIEGIQGSRYDDVLEGDNGANRLSGGIGDDTLKGNGGADRFIFEHSNRDDVILDFTDGEDRIDLTGIGLSGFDDLIMSSDSDGVTIHMTTSGGGTILLEGFDIANLDASDFIF